MSNCAKECVGGYVRGHARVYSSRQQQGGVMRAGGRVGLSRLTVSLYAVPERPRLREVIPLLTTNLFSRAPPACTEVKRGREGRTEK